MNIIKHLYSINKGWTVPNFMQFKMISVFLLLLYSGFSHSQWEKVYPNISTVWSSDNTQKHFNGKFDLYAMKPTSTASGNPAMWHMRDFAEEQVTDDKKYLSKASHYAYDCNKKLASNISIKVYSGHVAKGKTVAAFKMDEEWEAVKDGSMLEVTWEIACNKVTFEAVNYWQFNATPNNATTRINKLVGANGDVYSINPDHLNNLRVVLAAIKEKSGMNPPFFIIDDDSYNAFAGNILSQKMIALSLQLLQMIGSDETALATTIGHELAHLYYKHEQTVGMKIITPRKDESLFDSIKNFIIKPTEKINDMHAIYVSAAFSRDQEREADKLGMQWAMAAGYSPCGIVTTIKRLGDQRQGFYIPFLSSHPRDSERINDANVASKKMNGQVCK